MNNSSSIFAFLSLFLLTACGLFSGEDEPLASDLSRRSPVYNARPTTSVSSVPSAFSVAPNAALPPQIPFGANGPQAPEPPSFIGSVPSQPIAQPSPFVNSAPLSAPIKASAALPTSSPVRVVGLEQSAVGLPLKRRAPAFNGVEIGQPAQTSAILQQPQIQAPAFNVAQPLPRVTPIAPQQFVAPEVAIAAPQIQRVLPVQTSLPPVRSEFPNLAAVPPAQISVARTDVDPRVQALRDDIEKTIAVSEQPSADFSSLRALPNNPIVKPEAGFVVRPVQTRVSDLRPIPVAPVVRAEVQLAPPARALSQSSYSAPRAQPSSQPDIYVARNVTKLENLRPIGGYKNSAIRRVTSGNLGEPRRHSTRGGY